MAITRDRLRTAPTPETTEDVRRVRVLPVRSRRDRPSLDASIGARWAHALLSAWVVLFSVAIALEPAPADPSAAQPLYATLLAGAFFGLLAATVWGLGQRRRWGVLASVGASGIMLGMSVACPATGHHALAAWWFGQLACTVALAGLSAAAWRRTM